MRCGQKKSSQLLWLAHWVAVAAMPPFLTPRKGQGVVEKRITARVVGSFINRGTWWDVCAEGEMQELIPTWLV